MAEAVAGQRRARQRLPCFPAVLHEDGIHGGVQAVGALLLVRRRHAVRHAHAVLVLLLLLAEVVLLLLRVLPLLLVVVGVLLLLLVQLAQVLRQDGV
jgi:hypothetical protein